MKTRRKTAFTLVELLVVIAIIMILVGMLFPAIKEVSNSAKLAKVEARVKTLALGVTSYKHDYNYYPGQLVEFDGSNPLLGAYPSENPPKRYTGSQMLAEGLFIDYEDPTWDGTDDGSNHGTTPNKAKWKWTPKYAALTVGITGAGNGATFSDNSDLFNPKTCVPFSNDNATAVNGYNKPYSVSDQFPNYRMPVLYYPWGMSGTRQNKFNETDNSSFTACLSAFPWRDSGSPWEQGKRRFEVSNPSDDYYPGMINDARFSPAKSAGPAAVFNQGEFLLIAAGKPETVTFGQNFTGRFYSSASAVKNWNAK